MTAFEIMWPGLYDLVSANHTGALPLPRGAGLFVLFEAETGAGRDDDDFVNSLAPVIEAGIVEDMVLAKLAAERDALWAVCNNIPAMIAAFMPPVAYDVSVPLADMEQLVNSVQSQLAARWPKGRMTAFGHMGDNNLHLIVTLGEATANDKGALDQMIYGEVQKLGGSISADTASKLSMI